MWGGATVVGLPITSLELFERDLSKLERNDKKALAFRILEVVMVSQIESTNISLYSIAVELIPTRMEVIAPNCPSLPLIYIKEQRI